MCGMTIDEMREKAVKDRCNDCFAAVGDGMTRGLKVCGCVIDRLAWECDGPLTGAQLLETPEHIAITNDGEWCAG
jgi:hypothetical protein